MPDSANVFVDENQLIDIELPLTPGVDWLGIGQWLGISLMVGLVLVLLLWIATHYWLRASMQFQIRRAQKRLARLTVEADCQAMAYQVYAWFASAQRHQLLPTSKNQDLAAKINQACFSKTHVSRETVMALLQQFDQSLSQSRPKLTTSLHGLYQRLIQRWHRQNGGRDD